VRNKSREKGAKQNSPVPNIDRTLNDKKCKEKGDRKKKKKLPL